MLYHCADFISFSLAVFCFFLFVEKSNIAAGLDVSPLETWYINEAVLTGGTYWAFTAYNGDSSYPECIFIFGGNACTDCETVFCYNVTTNTLSDFGITLDSDLSGDRRATSSQSAFILTDDTDDLLYYILDDGDVYYFDLNDRDASEVLKASLDVTYPCLLKHPDDIEFYAIDANYGGEFYVYDLDTHTIHQGSTMSDPRYLTGCAMNNWDEDNPYIYVMGGISSWIERINLNDARNNEWETLQLILSNGLSNMCSVAVGSLRASGIASYANYVYLIGGYDGSREDDIFAVDVENWEVFWAGLLPVGVSHTTAVTAQDRIYLVGGYYSSSLDDVYVSNLFTEVSDEDITEDDDVISPMETWQINEAVLTGVTYWSFTAYNGDSSYPDCIFIFGGNVCTDCNTVFCYNITSDTLIDFGITLDSSLSGDRRATSQQSAFIISDDTDDLLYYAMDDGDVYYIDLNDGSEVLKTSLDVTYPCLLKNPDDSEFYAIDANNGGEFYIYDLESHTIHQGTTMTDPRYLPGCIVNEWNEDPYIYVMGGMSAWIERISIQGGNARNNEWETLSLILSNGLSDMCSVTIGSLRSSVIMNYNNFIYLIGGYDGSREDDIFALDVENWEIRWAGLFPTGISHSSGTVAGDRGYMIGGYTSSSIDDIYISNSFEEVSALAASQSTSCDDDDDDDDDGDATPTTTKPVTTGFLHKKEEMVNMNMEKEDMVLNNDNKNNINKNTNDVVLNVSVVFNLFLIIYVLTAASKCARINNKGDDQYQSI